MMTMKRARLTLVVILIAAAAIIGWLAMNRANTARTDARTVHIATFSTAIDYAPFYIARKLGLFDKALAPIGAKPSYTSFESLSPLNDSLRAGQLDVIFEAEPPALIAEAADTDIFVPVVSAVLRQQIIVRKDSGIKTMKDLSGRSIGVLTGTSSHFGLIEALRRAGVAPDSVKVVNLPPPEARAAFESGNIDAWAIWPPFPESEIAAGRAFALQGSEAPIVSMVVMRGSFVKKDEPAAKAIEQAIADAKSYIAMHPEEAKQIVADAVYQPMAVVNLAWPQHDFQAKISPALENQVQQTSDFLEQRKYLPRHVNVKIELFNEE